MLTFLGSDYTDGKWVQISQEILCENNISDLHIWESTNKNHSPRNSLIRKVQTQKFTPPPLPRKLRSLYTRKSPKQPTFTFSGINITEPSELNFRNTWFNSSNECRKTIRKTGKLSQLRHVSRNWDEAITVLSPLSSLD